jgi:hypothetical protein
MTPDTSIALMLLAFTLVAIGGLYLSVYVVHFAIAAVIIFLAAWLIERFPL